MSSSNSQDPLKNGSIFKLKNLRAIRSPNHVNKSTNNSPGSVTKNVTFTNDVKDNNNNNNNNNSNMNTTDSTALIKQRFDQIYRATPLPSVLFNNNTQFSSSNHNQSTVMFHRDESPRDEPMSSASSQPQISSSSLNRDRINNQHLDNQKLAQEQSYEEVDYNDNYNDNFTNDDNDDNMNDYNHDDDKMTNDQQIKNDKASNNNSTLVVAAPKRSSRRGLLAADTLQSVRIATPPSKSANSPSPREKSPQVHTYSKKLTVDSGVKKGIVDDVSDSDYKSKAQKTKVSRKKVKGRANDFEYDDDDSEYSGTEGKNKTTRSGRISQPVNRLTDDHLRSPNKDWKVTSPSKRALEVMAQEKKWEPSELSILYRVHAVTNPAAPDFWSLVSAGIKEMGVNKPAEACQDQWYQSMLEARERRNKKIAKEKNQSQNNNDDEITTENNEQDNVKKRKLNRAEMQQLAQKAVRAEKDDDIFDEINNRYNATETQNQLANTLELIKSPGGDIDTNKSNDKKEDNDLSNNNKWKASYVHNLSKKVKSSVAVKINNTTANKVNVIPKSKKITEGKVSAAISPSGKVRMTVKKVESDDDNDLDEEDIDEDD